MGFSEAASRSWVPLGKGCKEVADMMIVASHIFLASPDVFHLTTWMLREDADALRQRV